MSESAPKKIMISSVMRNFTEVRDEVANVITKSENVPILAEKILSDKPSKKTIEEIVKKSDYYIGIFHEKWGWVPPDDNPEKLSVTALEYTLAKDLGKPRLILVSESEKEQELQDFLNKIGEYYDGIWLHKYKTIPELVGTVGLWIGNRISKISKKIENIEDVKNEIINYTKKNILQIKDNIAAIYEKPIDFDEIYQKIHKNNIWIIGERGIGKSVIIKKLIENLLENKKNVLFLRSEDLLLKKSFQNVTNDEIGLSVKDLVDILVKNKEFLYLFIDSVDAIPRDQDAWTSFSSELVQILTNPKIRVILSIRKSDFQAFPQYFSREWGEQIFLKGFTEEQILKFLKKLDIDKIFDKKLYPVLKQPFFLEILATLVSNDKLKEISSLSSRHQFLKAHYDLVVRNSAKGEILTTKRADLLLKIAKKMLKAHRFKISSLSFTSTEEFDSLRSDGIIIEDDSSIQFFHQVYFDFIISIDIITSGKISDFLLSVGNETFLRSTIQFTLGYLHDQDFDGYLENLEAILSSSKIDDYWKNVTMGFVAHLNTTQENEQKLLEKLLNGSSDIQKYFFDAVIELGNSYWYNIWKDTLFDTWSTDKNFVHERLLVQYISISEGVTNV